MSPFAGLFLILFAAGSVLAGTCAVVAHRRSRDLWSAPLAFVLQLGGLFALLVGLFYLVFNGYVEDYGMQPARTLHIALPLLAVALVASAAAWAIALRPQARA
ncbi:hypothetical protein OM076_18160 [Solirubrobacter ginsenosidimutans]|uniref:Uncharacterized protein n=1 Tax=Solirubrobacter ginsenosidimutans TaxID=490573 RepID=A0A9X3MVV1_9ACTN|nr:hypothetical protein [Solirubrobacter ginsenosidimutans]MDA0162202.1 hypothetical protein [Solirubrobacter ginsenosidimutans]